MSNTARSLKVEQTAINDRPVVRVRGDVDLRTSPQLREQLLESSRQVAGTLLVDLSEVNYMDSSGVGTLVYVKREIERAGGRITLCGLQPRVRSVFEITHLDKFFTIVGSVDEAARS